MSTPMYEMPKHMAMPVDADGRGPVPVHEAHDVKCWCGVDGCTEYGSSVTAAIVKRCRGCRVEALGMTAPDDAHNHPLPPPLFREFPKI